MQSLKESDRVLDIGGWAHPFNRANYIMDAEPYETRGYYNRTFARSNPLPNIGGDREYFSADTWIQRDICEKTPYPFRDKELDYVICSHTLEDIRDPLWVCSEMIRIAKAGYLEIPSRLIESCRGHEPGIAGLSHHRWLIDIEANTVRFMFKLHRLHNRRYSLPRSVALSLKEEDKVQWLFWTDSFDYSEVMLHGDAQLAELKRFADSVRPYPQSLVWLEDRSRSFLGRLDRGIQRLRSIAG